MIKQIFATLIALIFIFLMCIAGFYIFSSWYIKENESKNNPEKTPIEIQDSGSGFNSQLYAGQKWILHVCADWSEPCANEATAIERFIDQYGPLNVVALAYKQDEGSNSQWANNNPNLYDHIVDDPSGLIGYKYGVFGAPTTIAFDEEGALIFKHEDLFDEKLIELLKSHGFAN